MIIPMTTSDDDDDDDDDVEKTDTRTKTFKLTYHVFTFCYDF